jgi:hypothetical protein
LACDENTKGMKFIFLGIGFVVLSNIFPSISIIEDSDDS